MKIDAMSFLAASADQHVREMHRTVSTGIGLVLAQMGEKSISITPESIQEFRRQFDVITEQSAEGLLYRVVRKAPADSVTTNLAI